MVTHAMLHRLLSLSGAALVCFGLSVPCMAQVDIFTQYQETGNSNTPAAIGKLFSNSGTCSASVVSGNNIIVTAAHCCWNRSTNKWIGGWSFTPAYNSGSAPYGTFAWAGARVLNSWINNGDVASDVCLISLQNDKDRHGVTYYTGGLGRAGNYGRPLSRHAPGNQGQHGARKACNLGVTTN